MVKFLFRILVERDGRGVAITNKHVVMAFREEDAGHECTDELLAAAAEILASELAEGFHDGVEGGAAKRAIRVNRGPEYRTKAPPLFTNPEGTTCPRCKQTHLHHHVAVTK